VGSKETEEAVGAAAERLADVLRHIEMWGSANFNPVHVISRYCQQPISGLSCQAKTMKRQKKGKSNI